MRWILVLERKSENALNKDTVRKHLKLIADSATKCKDSGFEARVGKLAEPDDIMEGLLRKRYRVKIRLEENKAPTPEVSQERFLLARKVLERCAGSMNWHIIGDDESLKHELTDSLKTPVAGVRSPFHPIDLTPDVIAGELGEIYEREEHLRLINDAVQTHALTNGGFRDHTILYGLPGGCKSTILERLKTMYDDDQHERMLILDASTMTKAGFENWLLEQASDGLLPEIIGLEEIDKVDNKEVLKCLGSMMASGYVMKTNAHIGRQVRKVNSLVIATCNDPTSVSAYMKGYIWDRTTNKIHCPLPSRGVMIKILLDKISHIVNGRDIWATKALELADAMKVTTPRRIISFLAGRYRLESGEYQKDRLTIARREVEENAKLGQSC